MGLRVGVLSPSFLARIGDERGLSVFREDVGEGGEGGKGSNPIGYSFLATLGEILGLLFAQRGFLKPLGEAAGLACFNIPCFLVLGKVPLKSSSLKCPSLDPVSPGVRVEELLGSLSSASMLRGLPSLPGDQSLSVKISERTWRARNADIS